MFRVVILVAFLIFDIVFGQHQSSFEYEDYTDNVIDSIPTSISPLEDFLLTIGNPFRIFNRPEDQVDRNTERFILGLPSGIRDVFFSGQSSVTKQKFGDVMSNYRKNIQAVFPGTRWCGAGDIARTSNDVGIFSQTDTCCRTHDACPEFITAGANSRGLRNNGIFARSHCSCDEEFRQCLLRTHSLISKKIGFTYFDILQPQCFKLEYPIKRCIRYASFPNLKKCLLYEFDTLSNKTWQWFDNKNFFIPFEF